jgi:hypothetical protein
MVGTARTDYEAAVDQLRSGARLIESGEDFHLWVRLSVELAARLKGRSDLRFDGEGWTIQREGEK